MCLFASLAQDYKGLSIFFYVIDKNVWDIFILYSKCMSDPVYLTIR